MRTGHAASCPTAEKSRCGGERQAPGSAQHWPLDLLSRGAWRRTPGGGVVELQEPPLALEHNWGNMWHQGGFRGACLPYGSCSPSWTAGRLIFNSSVSCQPVPVCLARVVRTGVLGASGFLRSVVILPWRLGLGSSRCGCDCASNTDAGE